MSNINLELWTDLARRSAVDAMDNLGAMVGDEIAVTSFGLRLVTLEEMAHLAGGPEEVTVGVYLAVSGSAEGHILMMYEPSVARAFADLLLGLQPGTTADLGDLECSALGEMGNVVGSSFLNVVADAAGLRLMPSPPYVVSDMAGALLDVMVADLLVTQDEAFVAEASFRSSMHRVAGNFFVFPGHELMQAVELQLREAA